MICIDRMNEDFSALSLTRKGKRLGHQVTVLARTGSTNDDAMMAAAQGGAEGEVIIAEEQDRGRGRLGRTWQSPAGRNLLFSIILRPGFAAERAPLITLAAGLAAGEAVKKVTGLDCIIKWPNDLLLGARKVCGMLSEVSIKGGYADPVILGLGLNVNARMEELDPAIRETATTLYETSGREFSRVELFHALMDALEYWYEKLLRREDQAIVEAWSARSGMIGKTVTVKMHDRETSGVAAGIDNQGALLIRNEEGLVRVMAGDVVKVR